MLVLHEGDSSTELSKLADETFDWIYIDGDHSFAGISRDINEATRLIKREGLVIFNDYTVYSPLERKQYGVARAVNDLCLETHAKIRVRLTWPPPPLVERG
jgi:predicted O-methyltransferase YrrM